MTVRIFMWTPRHMVGRWIWSGLGFILRKSTKSRLHTIFLGAVSDENEKLYTAIQTAGYVLVFREHHQSMIEKKKGNVDTDIVFAVMKAIADREKFDQVILVSGDGDYFKMVKYLMLKNRFKKLLYPNRKSMSSLYRSLMNNSLYAFLDDAGIKKKIKRVKSRK